MDTSGTGTGMLIGDIVRDAATRRSRALAGTLGEEAVSFGEVDLDAERLAAALRGAGIGRGEIVVWWSGPSLDSLAVMTACARAGAVFAPLSPLLGDAEAGAVVAYMRPALVIAAPETVERATALGASIAVLRGPAPAGVVDLAKLGASGDGAPSTADLDDADPHILYLTSGSTGRPKGVLVSHRASWLRSRRGGGSYGDDLDGVLCSFPLYHYGGWHYVLEAWLNGTAVHLVPKADGPHLRAALERRRPNAIYCIPAVWERLLAEPADLGGIRYADTGTSAVGDDLFTRLARRLRAGARTTVLYGASEAGRMTALRDEDLAARPDSVGRAVAPGKVRIAADGEILFAGPTLMNGYLDLPGESAAAIEDRWYHTGDLGTLDDEGYVRITGRKREVIRSGGETISPAEVETAIGPLAGVAELAVIGLPDRRWGEVVCAAVVLAPDGTAPTVDDLRAHLASLAPHKHPRLVAVVDAIPRTTATGQVMRGPLREAVLAAG